MRQFIDRFLVKTEFFWVPFVFISAHIMKRVRYIGFHRLPLSKKVLLKVGVFPVTNHYYEPQFDFSETNHSFSEERSLPGIDWNIKEQLSKLTEFVFSEELKNIPIEKQNSDIPQFYLNNSAFGFGDAEYWYQLIRSKKPNKIFEIGSGNSTLMAIKALLKNEEDNPEYKCKHVCIEPYEMPWLEETGVTIIRKKVEDIELAFFSELEEGDILFIDSSHIIRPGGDVLFEFLQVIPSLKKGVIVRVHDIFSPRNYLDKWIKEDIRFWNEQYLLEAFLSHSTSWKIIGSLNYLHHNYFESLKKVCPFLTPDKEPGSFYIQRIQ